MVTDNTSTHGIIQSKSFQLVGDEGEIRAELTLSDGFPVLSMRDQDGIIRLQVQIDRHGPGIHLIDNEGVVRVSLEDCPYGGHSGLTVYDQNGNPVVSINMDDDEKPAVYIHDP